MHQKARGSPRRLFAWVPVPLLGRHNPLKLDSMRATAWVKLMLKAQIKQIAPRSRMEWRAWLEENHARAHEVWLIFYKRRAGTSSLTYNDAVEEALC